MQDGAGGLTLISHVIVDGWAVGPGTGIYSHLDRPHSTPLICETQSDGRPLEMEMERDGDQEMERGMAIL